MNSPELRSLESFPEPEFSSLKAEVFADFGESSQLLSDVLADEASRRSRVPEPVLHPQELRIGAFAGERIVGWSFSRAEGKQLHMIHSGVHPEFRDRGIYGELVKATIAFAETSGFERIISRHVPGNNAVLIPKLRAGFVVSAFEYSEVYGPLVHLTYLTGAMRRELYRARSRPIVPRDAP